MAEGVRLVLGAGLVDEDAILVMNSFGNRHQNSLLLFQYIFDVFDVGINIEGNLTEVDEIRRVADLKYRKPRPLAGQRARGRQPPRVPAHDFHNGDGLEVI